MDPLPSVGWRSLFALSLCFIAFSACTPPATPALLPASPLPVFTPSPIPSTATPLPLFIPSPVPPTSSPPPLLPSSPTPAPAFLISALCSPLQDYTFAELPGIESQPFIPPRPGKDDGHHGVDFAHWQYKDRVTLEGVAVQSILSGVVAGTVVEKYPYGDAIIIETPLEYLSADVIAAYQIQRGQSLYLLYAHLQAPSSFEIGDPVTCGQGIGNVGNTGASGNPHLHLETRVGPAGVTFTSMEYYKTTSTNEERANYERWRFLGEFILFNPWTLLNLASG